MTKCLNPIDLAVALGLPVERLMSFTLKAEGGLCVVDARYLVPELQEDEERTETKRFAVVELQDAKT